MKNVMLFIVTILLYQGTFAQNIQGLVVDKNGETLIGVFIHALKSDTYSTSDLEGKFTIKAAEGEELEFSMIGMKKLVAKAALGSMKIVMETEAITLTESVVIGYGSKKQGSITGSVVQLKSDEIAKSPSQSAIQSIQGKAAGINIVSNDEPGKNPSIRVRGMGTVLGGRDPLYIIDGVEASNLNGLSSNEIEKIDILKDASSLAIYGQKGSNGVVVVTTKKGRPGTMKVNFDSYYSYKTIQRRIKMADSYRFAYYNNTALGSANYFSFNQPYNTNWLDEVTSSGYIASNYVSVSGGAENVNYYFGFTDYREEGILNGTEYKRNNISSRNDFTLFGGRLKFSDNLNVVFSKNTPKPLSVFTNAYKQSPIVPVRFDNGRWGIPLVNRTTGRIDINGDDRFNNVANPASQLYYTNEQGRDFNLFGSASAELKIFDYLKFNTNLGATYFYGKSYTFNPTSDIWLSQNPTSSLEDYEATFGDNSVIYNSLTQRRSDDYNWNWDNFLTFTKKYNIHQISAVLGITRSNKNNSEYLSGTRYNVPIQENYWYLNFSNYNTETSPQAVTSNSRQTPIVSIAYFMRADYELNNKYLLSASLRREGVSVFQKSQRWGIFPAVSAGWLIYREEFMKDLSFINFLKIRAGYGEVGNSNTGNAVNNLVFAQGYNYAFGTDQSIYPGSVVPFQVDPNLTWETMKEFDLGIDFTVFYNLFSGTLEFYNRQSDNLILPVTLPSVLSPNPVYVNTGQVINRGVEFSLKFTKEIKENFDYWISANIAYNYNELTKVDNAYFSNFIGGSLGNGQWVKQVLAGHPLGSFYVYQVTGFDDNGAFTYSATRVVAGSYLPKVTGGLNFGVNYRNFDFSAYFYGVAGNKVYNGKKAQRFGGENVEYDLLSDFWLPSNPDATNPKPFNDVPIASTYYVEDGSYLRLNNLTIGYSFKNLHEKIGKFRVYFSTMNPFVLTKFTGFTPELVGGDNANPLGNAGIELDAYPTTKSFIVGLNLEF